MKLINTCWYILICVCQCWSEAVGLPSKNSSTKDKDPRLRRSYGSGRLRNGRPHSEYDTQGVQRLHGLYDRPQTQHYHG